VTRNDKDSAEIVQEIADTPVTVRKADVAYAIDALTRVQQFYILPPRLAEEYNQVEMRLREAYAAAR
jgi:hypothetical protein